MCFILSSLIHISIVTVRKWLVRSVRTCVCEEVGLEVGPLVEAPLTDGAAVRRLLVVEDLVHGQGAVLAETFPTIIALERLLFGVDVAVVPAIVQITISICVEISRDCWICIYVSIHLRWSCLRKALPQMSQG